MLPNGEGPGTRDSTRPSSAETLTLRTKRTMQSWTTYDPKTDNARYQGTGSEPASPGDPCQANGRCGRRQKTGSEKGGVFKGRSEEKGRRAALAQARPTLGPRQRHVPLLYHISLILAAGRLCVDRRSHQYSWWNILDDYDRDEIIGGRYSSPFSSLGPSVPLGTKRLAISLFGVQR